MNSVIVWVRGAGVEGVNGMYQCERLFNNRPLFAHTDEVLGETYYLCRTFRGWMIVSSTSFPAKCDVQFYHCKSLEPLYTYLPPPETEWECAPRKAEGIRDLLHPSPTSVTYAWMTPTTVSIHKFATWILAAEASDDEQRVEKEVQRDHALRSVKGVCPSWLASGACTRRADGCDKAHPPKLRTDQTRPICVNFVSNTRGCERSSYMCNFVHPLSARHKCVLTILKSE